MYKDLLLWPVFGFIYTIFSNSRIYFRYWIGKKISFIKIEGFLKYLHHSILADYVTLNRTFFLARFDIRSPHIGKKYIRTCSKWLSTSFKTISGLFDSLSKYSFWAETYLMSPVLNFYVRKSTYLSENKNRFGSEIFLKLLPFFKNDLAICFLL